MDTRFWGPSGWKFLHLLLEMMPNQLNKTEQHIVKQFMLCWRDLLPCKYCRKSFTKYTTSYPIDKHCESRITLTRWLFVIHNKVNNKLRRQGYCNYDNPEFTLIQELYTNLATNTTNPIKLLLELGHDFLGSIIINYSAYIHNNSDRVPTINGYYYTMATVLPQMLEITISHHPAYHQESAPLMRQLHTYYRKTPLNLADDGNSNDRIGEANRHLQESRAHAADHIGSSDRHLRESKALAADVLIEWYYGIICLVNSHYCVSKVDKFVAHFEPYIVDSCNSKHSSQKLNSCRKKKTIKMVSAKVRKYTRHK